VNGRTVYWGTADDETETNYIPANFTIKSATIYEGNMNVVGGAAQRSITGFAPASQSNSAGSSAGIGLRTDGKPVVAYYDAQNALVRVVVASTQTPKLATNWTRYVTNLSCSGEVKVAVDGSNGIHLMYKNKNGKLCYAYASTENQTTQNMQTLVEEVIDSNGSLSYGSISVKRVVNDYIPCITYLNTANTDNCIKYAQRRVKAGLSITAVDNWDYQIIPSLGSGHYAIADHALSLEAYYEPTQGTGWAANTTATVLQNGGTIATATPATVDAVIAFKSNSFETAYLKKE
jgi:hypothetical protein